MRHALSGFGFLTGASYPFRALNFLFRYRRLWGYLIIPIFLNLIISIFLYLGLLFWTWQNLETLRINLDNWLDNLILNLPTWLGFIDELAIILYFVLRLLLAIALLILAGFFLTQIGVLLGSPWYGQLSEELEKIRTGRVEVVEVGIIRDLWRAILFELKKLCLMIAVGFPLFFLNFFVGIGTLIFNLVGLILTTTIVCLDFLDAPLERRRWKFRRKLGIVWKSFPASAGFGLVCLGLITIPLVNLVTIPLCVTAGTLFFCDRILPKLPPKS
jgi:CysZ protein